MARELHFENSQKQAALNALDLDAMQHEIEQLEATCIRLESPVVWSHNDLLSGNVMVTEQVRRVARGGVAATPLQLWGHHPCTLMRCDEWDHINGMDWHGRNEVNLWPCLPSPPAA